MNIKTLKKFLSFRTRDKILSGIVLHATAGRSVIGSLETLVLRKLSYHYIIDRDGTITKCVPLSKVAFHAGKSYAWAGNNCNEYTIGISFANLDDGIEKITEWQYTAVIELINTICSDSVGKNIKYLTSHYAISPGRKSDPKRCNFGLVNGGLKIPLNLYGVK
jgi:N-acetyl-anhydromuramyl-L-alanine amidase AmpD